jgi:hypothetical protein
LRPLPLGYPAIGSDTMAVARSVTRRRPLGREASLRKSYTYHRISASPTRSSSSDVEIFRSSGPESEQRMQMLTVSVREYDIADVRPVFGEGAD